MGKLTPEEQGSRLRGPSTCSPGCRESSIEPSLKSHHSRRPRKRSCDSMTDSSSCGSTKVLGTRRRPTELALGVAVEVQR
jgi:hypothetical protein